MFSKETEEWVGQVYVEEVNPRVPEYRMGYIVDVRHEGEGYATEAVKRVVDILFAEMEAYRISIECNDTNARNAAVAERCGFLREGHL